MSANLAVDNGVEPSELVKNKARHVDLFISMDHRPANDTQINHYFESKRIVEQQRSYFHLKVAVDE